MIESKYAASKRYLLDAKKFESSGDTSLVDPATRPYKFRPFKNGIKRNNSLYEKIEENKENSFELKENISPVSFDSHNNETYIEKSLGDNSPKVSFFSSALSNASSSFE